MINLLNIMTSFDNGMSIIVVSINNAVLFILLYCAVKYSMLFTLCKQREKSLINLIYCKYTIIHVR